MRYKAGTTIEVQRSEGDNRPGHLHLVVLEALTEGVLVSTPGAGTHPFPMFVKYEKIILPKVVPGRVYKHKGTGTFYVGREDGTLAKTGNLTTRRTDTKLSPEFEEISV